MSEMVERVARVLCEAAGEIADTATPYNPHAKYLWQHYVSSARAAIEAMREPTADMCECGPLIGEMTGDRTPAITTSQADAVWSAMVDAALHSPEILEARQ